MALNQFGSGCGSCARGRQRLRAAVCRWRRRRPRRSCATPPPHRRPARDRPRLAHRAPLGARRRRGCAPCRLAERERERRPLRPISSVSCVVTPRGPGGRPWWARQRRAATPFACTTSHAAHSDECTSVSASPMTISPRRAREHHVGRRASEAKRAVAARRREDDELLLAALEAVDRAHLASGGGEGEGLGESAVSRPRSRRPKRTSTSLLAAGRTPSVAAEAARLATRTA